MKKTARDTCLSTFQRLRVLQESAGDYGKCISCGKIYPVSQLDGGHYMSRRYRSTELDPMNVHPQCHHCNRFMNGNQPFYRRALVERYGEEAVTELEDRTNITIKRSEQEYRDFTKEFKKQIEEVKRNK